MPFTLEPDAHTQKNGRRYVTEIHSDVQGEYARVQYLAPVGADYNAIATAREIQLIESNAENEATKTVDDDLQPNPRFQTEDEMLLRMRVRYLNTVEEEACRIAKWFTDRIEDGSVLKAQCLVAFNVSSGQWNGIKNRMFEYASAINSVDGAVGE